MQISLKLIQRINHAKSTVCIKFQLLVTFSSLFTASSSLSVFPRSVLYIHTCIHSYSHAYIHTYIQSSTSKPSRIISWSILSMFHESIMEYGRNNQQTDQPTYQRTNQQSTSASNNAEAVVSVLPCRLRPSKARLIGWKIRDWRDCFVTKQQLSKSRTLLNSD